MPSGPKKRRAAARRKLAEEELVSSTAGATDSCIGSMETEVAAEVSNDDDVQLSQQVQVEEHVTDVVKELNEEAVPVSQQVEEHVSNALLKSEIMELPNNCNIGGDMLKETDGSAVADVVVCETCLSEVSVGNEIGSVETDVAVDGEDGNVVMEIDSTKSNEGVVVSEVVSSKNDGIVVGAAQLASKKDIKDIESFPGEGKDSPSLNGGCMSVEQADNSQDVGLNVKEPSAGDEETVFDVMLSREPPPLKKLNDGLQVSQEVEEHACNMNQEPVLMELLNDDANWAKESDCSNGGFSVPEVMSGVEVSVPVVAVQNDIGRDAKLVSKKDGKDSELVISEQRSHNVVVDSALTGSFPKLMVLVEQIEHLVQEAKALMTRQKGDM